MSPVSKRAVTVRYYGLTVCAAALVALLIVVVVLLAQRATRAENARDDVAQRATNRINSLLDNQQLQQQQLVAVSSQLAEALTKIDALDAQLQGLHVTPIVDAGATRVTVYRTRAVAPANPTKPATTTTTRPGRSNPPTTSTTTCTVRNPADGCVVR